MLAMRLRQHNLNFVPVLRELLRTRSVSRTAENIGLSQSAVSSVLARLREAFHDELLVTVGRRMELTAKADEIVEQVERACLELEVLFQPDLFDPATETRRFVIATADYVSFILGPAVAEIMAREAPRVSIHFIDIDSDVGSRLIRGEIDMIVIPRNTAGEFLEQFEWTPLFRDETVVITAHGDPRFADGLTREGYEAAAHAMFRLDARDSTSHEAEVLNRQHVRHDDRILVEHFLALPAIVEASNCLALVQRKMALRFQGSHAIDIHAPPFPVEDIEIVGLWSRSVHRNPAHRWLRDVMTRASERLGAAPAPAG